MKFIRLLLIFFESICVPMAFAQKIQGQPTFQNLWSLSSEGTSVVSDSGIQGDFAIILYNGKYYNYPYYSIANKFSFLNVKPPSFPAIEVANKFKYRNGTFWFAQHNKIYKFNRMLNTLEVVLKPEITFDTFEIDANGLILLIGGRQSSTGESRIVGGALTIHDLTTAHLIYAYKENAGSCDFVIDYPDEYWECVSRVGGLSEKNKTWVMGNNVLIFVRDMGFMYNYDSEKHSIYKVEAPWPCLSEKWLNEPHIIKIEAEAKAQGKLVDLPRNGLPNYIQIMPVNGRILIAYKENPTEVVYRKKIETEYTNRDAFIAFFSDVPTLDENGNSFWVLGELDLTKNSINVNQKFSTTAIPVPFWAGSVENLISIDGFVQTANGARNDTKPAD